MRAQGGHKYTLIFPIWQMPYEELLSELQRSGVPCTISAVLDEKTKSVISVGDTFSREMVEALRTVGVDEFGERGEFHTLA